MTSEPANDLTSAAVIPLGASPIGNLSDATANRWIGLPVPEQEFTIRDLVPEGMVTLLIADGGAGKSIFLQTALAQVALGASVANRSTKRGRTAGIFAEDAEEVLQIRQASVYDALDIDYAEVQQVADRITIKSLQGEVALLWRNGEPTQLMEVLECQLSEIDDLGLVTLDTAALVYGGEWNSPQEVQRFMNALNGMARRLRVGIILSTHTSKSSIRGDATRSASGTVQWVWASRSVLELTEEDRSKNTPPQITLIKANHRRKGLVIPLRWEGKVLLANVNDSIPVAAAREAKAKRVFFRLLARTSAQDRFMSHNNRSGNYAPRRFAKMPDHEGITQREFEIAMEGLFADDAIKTETYGRASDERRRIVGT